MSRFVVLGIVVLLSACQSTYYSAMEKIGIPKREIMVSRVEAAQESQEEAKEEFRSALEAFQSVVGSPGTSLQRQYDRLQDAYDDSLESAEAVSDRIESIENVSEALFEEWQQELALYTNAELRRKSQQQLSATQRNYRQLISGMRRAEKSMQPVLNTFRDQTLFLKHNLNAQSIASLETELASVQQNVDQLVIEMEKSIAEAQAFISLLQS